MDLQKKRELRSMKSEFLVTNSVYNPSADSKRKTKGDWRVPSYFCNPFFLEYQNYPEKIESHITKKIPIKKGDILIKVKSNYLLIKRLN